LEKNKNSCFVSKELTVLKELIVSKELTTNLLHKFVGLATKPFVITTTTLNVSPQIVPQNALK
jgi:hypothetical protein